MKMMLKVSVMILVASCMVANANLLTNADFEVAGATDVESAGWHVSSTTGGNNGFSRVLSDGNYCFEAWRKVGWDGDTGIVYLTHTDKVGVTAGESYTLSVMQRRTVSDSADVYLRVCWYDGSGNSLGLGQSTFSTTSDWAQISDTFVAPTGAAKAEVVVPIVLWGWAVRNVQVDDISFAAVPEPATMSILGFGLMFIRRRKK